MEADLADGTTSDYMLHMCSHRQFVIQMDPEITHIGLNTEVQQHRSVGQVFPYSATDLTCEAFRTLIIFCQYYIEFCQVLFFL